VKRDGGGAARGMLVSRGLMPETHLSVPVVWG
jgi:hypothetical protein